MLSKAKYVLFAVCITGCSMFSPRSKAKAVEVTADECVRIATLRCRPDIAQACRVVRDLAPLIELLGKGEVGAC